MDALRGTFALAAGVTAVVLVVGLAAVLLTVHRSPRPWRTGARALSVVSLLAPLVATLAPRSWPPQRDGLGDLVLAPGGDSLGRLDVLWSAPTSLAAVLLVLNVALYVPFGALAVLGWGRPGRVLLAAVAVSVGVELVQLLALSRVAATDDVVLNTVGAALGAATAVVLARTRHRPLGPAVPERLRSPA